MSKDGSLFTVYGSPFNSTFVFSKFRVFVIIFSGFWHLSFDIHLAFGLWHLKLNIQYFIVVALFSKANKGHVFRI